MLNVSTLIGARVSASDALRYGKDRSGEVTPRAAGTRRPVVVWNTTLACNLACAHCYASAKSQPGPEELTTAEGKTLLADLAEFGVPAVLLSGGEPLVRPDLPDLVRFGVDRGLRFTLSTNGILIDPARARLLADAGVIYVGVSIDGDEATHDHLRRQQGAYQQSIIGLRNLGDAGVRRGVRFTLSPWSAPGLSGVLDLLLAEGIDRFCMYHLVPSGRGGRLDDVTPEERRRVLETVFQFAADHPDIEILTVDNPADGAALHRWLLERDEEAAQRCREMLEWNGGARNGPGVALAAIDQKGDVHPDQFSRHRTLGNVRERPFSEIWSDPDEYLLQLRSPSRPMPEECRSCTYLPMCGGGLRSRAELATGDPWAFDPSCTIEWAAA